MSIYQLPKIARPSKKKWLAFVIPDVHRGYHTGLPTYDPCVWDVGMQSLKHLAPRLTHLIILGDFGNFESLSHWAAQRAEHVFIEEDLQIVQMGLDEIDEICDKYNIKKVFVEGNHEFWGSLLEAKYPQFRNMINLKSRMFKARKNWTWVPNNHFFKLGKIHLTHGNYPGGRDAQAMLKEIGQSVLYGHTHGHEIAYKNNLAGIHMAMSSGCWAMIDPPPAYSKAKIPGNWVHGFTVVQIRNNGLFQVRFHTIIDSTYTELLDGTEIVANRARIKERLTLEAGALKTLREDYEERYYVPGGPVHEPEPITTTEYAARGRRARVISNGVK